MQQLYSYWEKTSFFSETDVVVVGSGIVGLSAAVHLKSVQPDLKVTVLEAGFLPSGASTKNAGFACFGSVSELLNELAESTEEEVLQTVEMRWKGLLKLRENLGDEAIDYISRGGYDVFKSAEKQWAEQCVEALPYLNKLVKEVTGIADIYAVADEKIADFGFRGIDTLIHNRGEGQLDTGKMMRLLIAKAWNTGVLLLNNCHVQKIEGGAGGHVLQTNQGLFKTRQVILAANAFTQMLYPALDITPGRGQVLVTKPVENLRFKGTFHYDKGFYYFRDIDNRILLGGGRNIDFKTEETHTDGITPVVQQALEDLLYTTITPHERPEIEYRWSGIMGFGKELKPIIKQLEPGLFCAARCNGMGVAMGTLLGQQVAELAINNR